MNNRLILSSVIMDMILNDNFAMPDDVPFDYRIYVGLGIEFDENTFSFTKEPVSQGFTILPEPVEFSDARDGMIYNKNAIEWPKAKEDWTKGSDEIRYIGLYYKVNTLNESSESESQKSEYFLMGVLPLAPSETVLINEQMVLNANSIVIKLSNR